mmetsp:Transcript_13098/g.24023  ORF Transcript_13098/g.24023 Transcript_13098/m.24023 type:complete len:619 (-) Transcript_13098:514-2370(-)
MIVNRPLHAPLRVEVALHSYSKVDADPAPPALVARHVVPEFRPPEGRHLPHSALEGLVLSALHFRLDPQRRRRRLRVRQRQPEVQLSWLVPVLCVAVRPHALARRTGLNADRRRSLDVELQRILVTAELPLQVRDDRLVHERVKCSQELLVRRHQGGEGLLALALVLLHEAPPLQGYVLQHLKVPLKNVPDPSLQHLGDGGAQPVRVGEGGLLEGCGGQGFSDWALVVLAGFRVLGRVVRGPEDGHVCDNLSSLSNSITRGGLQNNPPRGRDPQNSAVPQRHAVARTVGPHDAPLPLVQAQVRAADHRHLWLPRLGQLVGPDAQDVGALQRNRVDGAVLGAEPVLPLVLDVDLVLEAGSYFSDLLRFGVHLNDPVAVGRDEVDVPVDSQNTAQKLVLAVVPVLARPDLALAKDLDLPSRRTHLQAAVCVRRYSQYVPVGVHQPSVPLVPPLWERPYDVNGGCLRVDLQDAVGALRHAVDAAVRLSGEAAVPLALALEGPSDVRDAVVLGVDDQDPLGLLRDAPYSPLCQIPAVVLPHLSSQISESLDLPRRGDDLEHAVRVARQAVDGLVAVSVDGLDAAKPLEISFEDWTNKIRNTRLTVDPQNLSGASRDGVNSSV